MNLFPYQRHGAAWLSDRRNAILADEMGLGKSAQAITACDHINAKNILVVSPAAVCINWTREFGRFSDIIRDITHIKTGKHTPRPGVNVISYDLIARSEAVKDALHEMTFDVIILDECHYLKERDTLRTRAIYGQRVSPGIISRTNRVWRLSGTPILNFANELYPHLKSMGLISDSYWDFVYRYCTGFDGDYGYKITGHKNVDELQNIIGPHMLRRKKSEVLTDMPPISFHEVTVGARPVPGHLLNRDPTQAKIDLAETKTLNAALRARLVKVLDQPKPDIDGAVDVLTASAAAMATLRRWIGLAKLDETIDIITEDLETGAIKKIVLFGIHTQVIDIARQRLAKFRPVVLYGATPQNQRQTAIDAFQSDPNTRVFLGNVIAAGTGITLTAAHEVGFLESDWTPAVNLQASMRCHRISQTNPVRVRIFTCANSVDEEVSRVLSIKSREIAKILD